MNAPTVLLVLALALAQGTPVPSGPGPEAEDAASVFQQAFSKGTAEDRTRALERVAKEFPASQWADDALWALGEIARREGHDRRVAYCWRYLMAVRPEPQLEEFTRSLDLYRDSGLPQVEFYLRVTGKSYVQNDGRVEQGSKLFLNVKPLSPVPMLVWEGLGRSYERLGRLELAIKAYEEALRCAPAGGQWRQVYRDSARRVEAQLATTKKPKTPPPVAAASPPAEGANPGTPSAAAPAAASPGGQDQPLEQAQGD